MTIYETIQNRLISTWGTFYNMQKWFDKYKSDFLTTRNNYVLARKFPKASNNSTDLVLPQTYMEEEEARQQSENSYDLYVKVNSTEVSLIASTNYGHAKISNDNYLLHESSIFFTVDTEVIKRMFNNK